MREEMAQLRGELKGKIHDPANCPNKLLIDKALQTIGNARAFVSGVAFAWAALGGLVVIGAQEVLKRILN